MSAERPIVVLEIPPPSQFNVLGPHEGAVVAGLKERYGVRTIHADFRDPNHTFTSDGMAVEQFRVPNPTRPGWLVPPSGESMPIRPDVYRALDTPSHVRPLFAKSESGTPGYNNGKLCSRLTTRRGMLEEIEDLGCADLLPPYVVASGRSIANELEGIDGDKVFVKPSPGYSDIYEDATDIMRRAQYLSHAEAVALLRGEDYGYGENGAILQEDIAAPIGEIAAKLARLAIDSNTVYDIDRREHHTIRMYQMTGARGFLREPDMPDVAEIRLMAPEDIGKPEPSYYVLREPADVFAAFEDAGLYPSHYRLMTAIGEEYGLNYCAADYIITKQGGVAITGLHVRPRLPDFDPDERSLGYRTVATEITVLGLLATRGR